MEALQNLLKEIHLLKTTQSALSWDQETQLPDGAIDFRSEQLSYLSKLEHEKLTSSQFSAILSEFVDLETGFVNSKLSEKEQRFLQCIYKDWKKASSLPQSFVIRYSKLCSKAQHVWQKAREQQAFHEFSPYLEELVQLSKEKAAYIDSTKKPYDVLLDTYEEDLNSDFLTPIFKELRLSIVNLISKLKQSSAQFYDLTKHQYDKDKQWQFGIDVLERMGYNFHCGRQDISTHPFTIDISPFDVRITTRVDEFNLMEALSSSIHEGGHGLYEQGLNTETLGSPFSEALSLGFHESQSRLWEKVIGQSMPFWTYFYPKLQALFPQLSDCSLSDFYASINEVKPGFIRVESDELTYNLHILIRYEIEQALFNDNISVKSLPELWNAKMKDYLGLDVKNDSQGVLQDVHWSCGLFGYFPTYTLGNLYSTMLFDQIKKDIPELETLISKGNFLVIKNWCQDNVYCHGRLYTPKQLIKRITGSSLSCNSFVSYLNRKYSEIYQFQ